MALASLEGNPVSCSSSRVYYCTMLAISGPGDILLARQMPGPNTRDTEKIVVE